LPPLAPHNCSQPLRSHSHSTHPETLSSLTRSLALSHARRCASCPQAATPLVVCTPAPPLLLFLPHTASRALSVLNCSPRPLTRHLPRASDPHVAAHMACRPRRWLSLLPTPHLPWMATGTATKITSPGLLPSPPPDLSPTLSSPSPTSSACTPKLLVLIHSTKHH
jgi:hypothetical protein